MITMSSCWKNRFLLFIVCLTLVIAYLTQDARYVEILHDNETDSLRLSKRNANANVIRQQLSQPCRTSDDIDNDNNKGHSTEIPRFVSFAWTHVGRWTREELITGVQLMYSSLARAHECQPLLYVYTNDEIVQTRLESLTTTMNTPAQIQVILQDVDSIQSHGYDPWRDLSRYKLNVMSEHVVQRKEPAVVWIDIDTLVFINLAAAFVKAPSWVPGWVHGSSKARLKHFRSDFSGFNVPAAFQAYGDLWALDARAIQDVVALENDLVERGIEKPKYDLQGYFSILLAKNMSNIQLLQDILPEYSYGFQCSKFDYPTKRNFNAKVMHGLLHCPDVQKIGFASQVGTISFTASTFMEMMISEPRHFSKFPNAPVREWLQQWFYLDH